MDEKQKLSEVQAALDRVKQLIDRRNFVERQLLEIEIDLAREWKNVPAMPVRSSDQIDIAERVAEKRSTRLMKAARGNKDVASIIGDLLYGREDNVWRH